MDFSVVFSAGLGATPPANFAVKKVAAEVFLVVSGWLVGRAELSFEIGCRGPSATRIAI
jgi:hypothetical protein